MKPFNENEIEFIQKWLQKYGKPANIKLVPVDEDKWRKNK